jgi:hypothetical protein
MAKTLILILTLVFSLTIFAQDQESNLDDYGHHTPNNPGGVVPGPVPYSNLPWNLHLNRRFRAFPAPAPQTEQQVSSYP